MRNGQQIKMKKKFIFLFTFKKAIIPPRSPIHVVRRPNTKGTFVSRKDKKYTRNRIGFLPKITKCGYKNAQLGIYIVVLYESFPDILSRFLSRICRRHLHRGANFLYLFVAIA